MKSAKLVLLAWFALFSPSAHAAGLPALTIPEGVGVNIHFSRGHEQDLDRIAAAGFKFVRMDLGWAGIEREKGQYNWSAYDELTANLEKRGLSAIYILDYSNPLYEETITAKNPITGQQHRDTASPQHPESVAAFAKWAAAAASHFRGRPILWEIWNEPNITFWKPKPDVQQYCTLALATCQAIRAAVPEAAILAPGTSGIPFDFLENFFKAGGLSQLDGVSVHPYRKHSRPPESALEDYARLRELVARYGNTSKQKQLPIISSEWGYASHIKGVSPEIQASYLVRQQLVNLSAGVPISIWYDWKNDGPDPAEREHNFGTVTRDLQPKPAYRAVQTMTRELAGFGVDHRLKTESDRDYILVCTNRAGDQKLAAWSLAASNSVTLYVTESASPIRVVTGDGQPSTLQPRQNGVALPLGPLPAYVTLAPRRLR